MRLVVPQFITETYPTEMVFLSVHVSDGGTIAWGNARWDEYFPNPDYIPQVVVGCNPDTFIGYPGVPPAPWINRVEAQRALPTDITMALSTALVAGNDWSFTAQVCMESTGVARTVRVFIGYTIDDYPVNSAYPYLATIRNVGAYEDLALDPGVCLDVERTFTFDQIDLDRRRTIVGVAWAQTPNAGFGEAYQATKAPTPFLVFADDFESGDTSQWSLTVP
jgi:hypothetical protein